MEEGGNRRGDGGPFSGGGRTGKWAAFCGAFRPYDRTTSLTGSAEGGASRSSSLRVVVRRSVSSLLSFKLARWGGREPIFLLESWFISLLFFITN